MEVILILLKCLPTRGFKALQVRPWRRENACILKNSSEEKNYGHYNFILKVLPSTMETVYLKKFLVNIAGGGGGVFFG